MSENYYILLDLDPRVDDWTVIEAAIKNHQRRWSMQKNQGRPEDRRKADRYIRLIPDMQAKLSDPNERRKIADAAVKLCKDQKDEQYEKLNQLIGFLSGSTIDPDALKVLVRQLQGKISESEIVSELKRKGITIASGRAGRGASKVRPKLDPTTAQNIRDNLKHLGLKSLYDFLSLGLRSSPQSLCDAADGIYKDIRRKGLTDPDSNARQELAGYAKAVFKNVSEKEKYDNTYAVEAMEDLKSHLEIAGAESFLEQEKIDRLVREARSKGVSQNVAVEYIEEFARKRKWKIQGKPSRPAAELKLCGFCDTLARSPKESRCRQCGQTYIQDCPRCGNPTPTQDACCGSCGCNTGDAPLVQGLLRKGKKRLVEGDLGNALACFEKALIYWEDWKPALEAKRHVAATRRRRDTALDKIDAMLRGRKLEEAQSELDRFRREFGASGTEDIECRIHKGIGLAGTAYQSAETLKSAGRGEDAVDKYMEALSHCTDFQLARLALAASPPPAPSGLKLTAAGDAAQLNWLQVKARGSLSYRIVRKPASVPTGPVDGATVGEVRATTFQDTSVPPGRPWYYAVFALRGGVPSAMPASSGPHIWLAEPMDVRVEPGDGQVALRWRRPAGCRQVEVWRRPLTSLVKPGMGKQLSVSGDSLVDQGLKNGTNYRYRIVACYTDPNDGRGIVRSRGVNVDATPVTLPPAIQDLQATLEERDVLLTWTPPTAGDVQIRLTRKKPNFSTGRVIPLSLADQFGVPVTATGRGTAQATLDGQRRVFFIPLSVVAQTAVMGSPVAVTTLDEVTDIETQRQGNDIHLTWKWPPGAVEVMIGWRHDAFPGQPEEASGGQMAVSINEYDRNGMWELRKAKRARHYFTVFVHDPDAGIYSSGQHALEASGMEALVNYRVVTQRSLLRRTVKKAWIELKTNDAIRALPTLMAVQKSGLPPLRLGDGQTIAKVDRLSFTEGVARIDLPINGGGGFVKLFFKNGQHAREFRLLSAPLEQLKIG